MLIHTFYTIAVLIYLLRCLLPRVCTVVFVLSYVLSRLTIRTSAERNQERSPLLRLPPELQIITRSVVTTMVRHRRLGLGTKAATSYVLVTPHWQQPVSSGCRRGYRAMESN